MNKTSIEWTSFSANPLKYRDSSGKVVWGCVKTSPGCAHCYSEALGLRYGRGGPFTAASMRGLTPFLDEKELHRMLTYKPAAGKRCFVGDMTDLFGEWVPDELLDRLFAVMALRSDVTWQLLTKRAGRMRDYLRMVQDDDKDLQRFVNAAPELETPCAAGIFEDVDWPFPNIHAGVSVEDQQRADERIPLLLQTPAAVRFLSCEPLLSQVRLDRISDGRNGWIDCLGGVYGHGFSTDHAGDGTEGIPDGITDPIDWVIVGGESGPKARPMHPKWARSLRDQCAAAGVPFFFKQWGEWAPSGSPGTHKMLLMDRDGSMSEHNPPLGVGRHPRDGLATVYRVGKHAAGRLLDGREWNEFPEVANATHR